MFPPATCAGAGAGPGRGTQQKNITTYATSFAAESATLDSQTETYLRYIFDTLGSSCTPEEALTALQTCENDPDGAILKLLALRAKHTQASQGIAQMDYQRRPLDSLLPKAPSEGIDLRSQLSAEDRRILDICAKIRSTNAQLNYIFQRYDTSNAYSHKKDIINKEFEELLKEQRHLLRLTCAGRNLHNELEHASAEHASLLTLIARRLNILLVRVEENDQLMLGLAEELDRTLKRVNALESTDAVRPLDPVCNNDEGSTSTQLRAFSSFSHWMNNGLHHEEPKNYAPVLEDPFVTGKNDSSQDHLPVHHGPAPEPCLDLIDLDDEPSVLRGHNTSVMALTYHPDVLGFRYPHLFAPAPVMSADLKSRRVMLTNLPSDICYAQLLRGVRGFGSQATASILPRRSTSADQDCLPLTGCALVEFLSHEAAAAFVTVREVHPLIYCDENAKPRQALVRLVPTTSYRVIASGNGPWPSNATCALDIHGVPRHALWFFLCTIGVCHVTYIDFNETANVLHVEFVTRIHANKARCVLQQRRGTPEMVFDNVTVSFSSETMGHSLAGEPIAYIRPDHLEIEYDCAPYNQYPVQAQEDLLQYSSPTSEGTSSSQRATPSVEDTSETERSCDDTRDSSFTAEQDAHFAVYGIKDIRRWEQYGALARRRCEKTAALQQGRELAGKPCGSVGCAEGCCDDLKKAPVPRIIQEFLNPIEGDHEGL